MLFLPFTNFLKVTLLCYRAQAFLANPFDDANGTENLSIFNNGFPGTARQGGSEQNTQQATHSERENNQQLSFHLNSETTNSPAESVNPQQNSSDLSKTFLKSDASQNLLNDFTKNKTEEENTTKNTTFATETCKSTNKILNQTDESTDIVKPAVIPPTQFFKLYPFQAFTSQSFKIRMRELSRSQGLPQTPLRLNNLTRITDQLFSSSSPTLPEYSSEIYSYTPYKQAELTAMPQITNTQLEDQSEASSAIISLSNPSTEILWNFYNPNLTESPESAFLLKFKSYKIIKIGKSFKNNHNLLLEHGKHINNLLELQRKALNNHPEGLHQSDITYIQQKALSNWKYRIINKSHQTNLRILCAAQLAMAGLHYCIPFNFYSNLQKMSTEDEALLTYFMIRNKNAKYFSRFFTFFYRSVDDLQLKEPAKPTLERQLKVLHALPRVLLNAFTNEITEEADKMNSQISALLPGVLTITEKIFAASPSRSGWFENTTLLNGVLSTEETAQLITFWYAVIFSATLESLEIVRKSEVYKKYRFSSEMQAHRGLLVLTEGNKRSSAVTNDSRQKKMSFERCCSTAAQEITEIPDRILRFIDQIPHGILQTAPWECWYFILASLKRSMPYSEFCAYVITCTPPLLTIKLLTSDLFHLQMKNMLMSFWLYMGMPHADFILESADLLLSDGYLQCTAYLLQGLPPHLLARMPENTVSKICSRILLALQRQAAIREDKKTSGVTRREELNSQLVEEISLTKDNASVPGPSKPVLSSLGLNNQQVDEKKNQFKRIINLNESKPTKKNSDNAISAQNDPKTKYSPNKIAPALSQKNNSPPPNKIRKKENLKAQPRKNQSQSSEELAESSETQSASEEDFDFTNQVATKSKLTAFLWFFSLLRNMKSELSDNEVSIILENTQSAASLIQVTERIFAQEEGKYSLSDTPYLSLQAWKVRSDLLVLFGDPINFNNDGKKLDFLRKIVGNNLQDKTLPIADAFKHLNNDIWWPRTAETVAYLQQGAPLLFKQLIEKSVNLMKMKDKTEHIKILRFLEGLLSSEWFKTAMQHTSTALDSVSLVLLDTYKNSLKENTNLVLRERTEIERLNTLITTPEKTTHTLHSSTTTQNHHKTENRRNNIRILRDLANQLTFDLKDTQSNAFEIHNSNFYFIIQENPRITITMPALNKLIRAISNSKAISIQSYTRLVKSIENLKFYLLELLSRLECNDHLIITIEMIFKDIFGLNIDKRTADQSRLIDRNGQDGLFSLPCTGMALPGQKGQNSLLRRILKNVSCVYAYYLSNGMQVDVWSQAFQWISSHPLTEEIRQGIPSSWIEEVCSSHTLSSLALQAQRDGAGGSILAYLLTRENNSAAAAPCSAFSGKAGTANILDKLKKIIELLDWQESA